MPFLDLYITKKNCENSSFLKAPTRFELVITVLQTGALPLGYGAISDSDGNRTRVTAVKGRCLNRLTTEPRPLFNYKELPE